MNLKPVQNSFAGGELSPLLYMRSDEDMYRQSVEEMTNFIPDSRGPAVRRNGTVMTWWDKDGVYPVEGRLFAFNATLNEAFVVLVTQTDIIVLDRNGIKDEGNPISNGGFSLGGTDWDSQGPVSFYNGYVKVGRDYGIGNITHDYYDHRLVTQINGVNTPASQYVTTGYVPDDNEASWVYATRRLPEGTERFAVQGDASEAGVFTHDGVEYIVNSTSYDPAVNMTMINFSPALEKYITASVVLRYKIQPGVDVDVENDITFAKSSGIGYVWQQVTVANPGNEQSLRITCLGDYDTPPEYEVHLMETIPSDDSLHFHIEQAVGKDVTINFTAPVATFYVQVRVYADKPPVNFDELLMTDTVTGSTGEVTFTSPYDTDDILEEVQVAMPPGLNEMYFTQRNTTPRRLTYLNGAWAFEEITFQTDAGGGIMPWGNNPPGCVAYHQGRMWYAGSIDKPSTIWASVPGDYLDLRLNASDQADDGLEFELKARGEIRWMLSMKDMHIGTADNENILVSDGLIITPMDNDSKQQSSFGSTRVQAVPIESGFMWVDNQRRKIYYSHWMNDYDSYKGEDSTFRAEHITEPLVNGITVTQSSSTIAWHSMADGTIVGNSVEVARNILGWHKHKTGGTILSVVSLREFGDSVLYGLVRRKVLGEKRLMVERMDNRVYMDSASVFNHTAPVSTVTGLEHLEGNIVQVLVDGAVQADKVVNNGMIDLDIDGKDIVVGMKYTSTLLTLPIEMTTREGGITSRMKHYTSLYARLSRSAIPLINGEEPRVRTPQTPMDTPEPLISDDVLIHDLGWDMYGRIKIETDLPYPCVVTGLFAEMGAEGL